MNTPTDRLLAMAVLILLALLVLQVAEVDRVRQLCETQIVPFYLAGPLAAPTETARPAWLVAPGATATPEDLR